MEKVLVFMSANHGKLFLGSADENLLSEIDLFKLLKVLSQPRIYSNSLAKTFVREISSNSELVSHFKPILENVTTYIEGLDSDDDFCLGNLLTVYGLYSTNKLTSAVASNLLLFHSFVNVNGFLGNVQTFYAGKTVKDIKEIYKVARGVIDNVSVPTSTVNRCLRIQANYRIFLEEGDFLGPLPVKRGGADAGGARGGKAGAKGGRGGKAMPTKETEISIPEDSEPKMTVVPILDLELGIYENIYKQYRFILEKMTVVLNNFLTVIFDMVETNEKTKAADSVESRAQKATYLDLCLNEISNFDIFSQIKQIIIHVDELSPVVKALLCGMVFNLLYHLGQSPQRAGTSHLYYKSLKGRFSHDELENMESIVEHMIRVENLENLHPASATVFLDFALCCFETLFDGDMKKKSFSIMKRLMFVDGAKSAKYVFQFILANINDLRYPETQGYLKTLIEYLSKNAKHTDLLLELFKGLLEYEVFAHKYIFGALLETDKSILSGLQYTEFER